MKFSNVLATTAACLLACLVVSGCSEPCPDCTRDRSPRPHAVNVYEAHAGGRHINVCCGDQVRVHLRCHGGKCHTLRSSAVPHLVYQGHDGGEVFTFRAAAPGQCCLRFSGPHDLEFHFNVCP